MTPMRSGNYLKIILGVMVIGAAVMLFVLFGPPKLLAKTSTPDYCMSCHVMESQFEAWFHTGAHRRIKCVDCHLPNGNAGIHYIWKSIDGMKDVLVFYSGTVPDRIMLSTHGEKVLRENCIRCHDTAVAMIDTTRNCWGCHRWVTHTRNAAIETL